MCARTQSTRICFLFSLFHKKNIREKSHISTGTALALGVPGSRATFIDATPPPPKLFNSPFAFSAAPPFPAGCRLHHLLLLLCSIGASGGGGGLRLEAGWRTCSGRRWQPGLSGPVDCFCSCFGSGYSLKQPQADTK